jgi:hypothetical protein
MEKVLANPILSFSMSNYCLPPKVAMATKEVVVGICASLQETKQSNSNDKLATKHCILTTIVRGIFY